MKILNVLQKVPIFIEVPISTPMKEQTVGVGMDQIRAGLI